MRRRLIVLNFVIFVFTACSTQKIIVPDIALTEKEKYSTIKEGIILVTTNDSVTYKLKEEDSDRVIEKYKPLVSWPVSNYAFSNGSLIINDAGFESRINLNKIKNIRSKGIWDDEIGFISECEINKASSRNFGQWFIGSLLGAASSYLIGALIGGEVGIIISSKPSFAPLGLYVAGAGAGMLMGLLFMPEMLWPVKTLPEVIEIIKEKEMQKLKAYKQGAK